MVKFLQEASNFSVLIPLLAGAIRLFQRKKVPWEIMALLFVSFVSDQASRALVSLFGSNYWIINIYLMLEIIFIGIFYYRALDRSKAAVYFIVVLLLVLVSLLIWQGINLFNGYFLSLYSLVNIGMCLAIFYHIYQKAEDLFLEESSVFLITCAFLLYFSGSFFTFGLSQYILESESLDYSLFHLSSSIKNLVLALGLWKIR